jgi:hypothetical protein
MSEDAYTRIALRLRDVVPDDREWLLGQLGEDECRRVSAALREHRRLGVAPATGPIKSPVVGSPRELPAAGVDPTSRLAAATSSDIGKLLEGQPDWVFALLLLDGDWPWAAEFLDTLPAERIRRLRALAGELSLCVKPRVRESVVSMLSAKLETRPVVTPVARAFDAALERATAAMTVREDWKLDLS